MKSEAIYDINKKFIVTMLKSIIGNPTDIVFDFKDIYIAVDVNKDREQASIVFSDKDGKEIVSFFKHYKKYTAYSNCTPIRDFIDDENINNTLKDLIFDGTKILKFLYGEIGYRLVGRELYILLNEHTKIKIKDNFSYIL